MTDSAWKEDAARLAAVLAEGRGAMLWERSSDGRWYLAATIRSLFEETILELRWGGAGKNPSRIVRQPLESADLKALANGICRRRRQHGYVPSPRSHGNDS
ncbi:hypothetical protein JKG47_07485 [Acidithiobacillus sp. MC6.1]|nr:hypothetical protein [Acidithiobacillus sp. MC6.1]